MIFSTLTGIRIDLFACPKNVLSVELSCTCANLFIVKVISDFSSLGVPRTWSTISASFRHHASGLARNGLLPSLGGKIYYDFTVGLTLNTST